MARDGQKRPRRQGQRGKVVTVAMTEYHLWAMEPGF
jgi:hypothetical protein